MAIRIIAVPSRLAAACRAFITNIMSRGALEFRSTSFSRTFQKGLEGVRERRKKKKKRKEEDKNKKKRNEKTIKKPIDRFFSISFLLSFFVPSCFFSFRFSFLFFVSYLFIILFIFFRSRHKNVHSLFVSPIVLNDFFFPSKYIPFNLEYN